MTGTRIAIIILVLIAALFATGVAIGVNKRRGKQSLDKQSAKHYSAPNWLNNLAPLFSRFGPRLKAEEMKPLNNDSVLKGNTFVVGQSQAEFAVQPSQDRFRKATFVLKEGRGLNVLYEAADSDAGDLSKQEWPAADDDPQKGSVVILKGGGKLKMSCNQKPPCAVELQ